MSNVEVEFEAYWECPKCENRIDEISSGVELEDNHPEVVCNELVDNGGDDFEVCGHVYRISYRR